MAAYTLANSCLQIPWKHPNQARYNTNKYDFYQASHEALAVLAWGSLAQMNSLTVLQ